MVAAGRDRRAFVYPAGVITAGLLIIPVGWLMHPVQWSQIGILVYLAVFTQVAALLPIPWNGGLQHVFTPPLVAAGLVAPGGGVALVVWLALYDRRRIGRDAPLWRLMGARGTIAVTHGVASLIVAGIDVPAPFDLPVKTVAYSFLIAAINLPITSALMAAISNSSTAKQIRENVGFASVQAIVVLGLAGGLLWLVLQVPVGFLMAPSLGGVLLAVRANHRDVQRQLNLRDQTLELAAQALDARDSYTERHSHRVSELAVSIAQRLHLSARDTEAVRVAGLLHDIGKIGIPDHILHKPGPLASDERAIMNTHAALGADLIATHSDLSALAPLVRHHHEQWDGGGYPSGLSAHAIPLGARVLAVADAFDTMTGVRAYRTGRMTVDEGVQELIRCAATHFDPTVVAAAAMAIQRPASDDPVGTDEPRQLWRNSRFSRLAAGMTISALGDPLSTVAVLVVVYSITRLALLVAAVYVLKATATIIATTMFGALGDRFQRGRLIGVLEVLRAATVASIPLGILRVGPSYVLAGVFGIALIQAVVQPTRLAVLAQLVPDRQLSEAMGAVATTTTLASMAGFGVAGVLLALSRGTNLLFYVDAVTFAAAGMLVVGMGAAGGGSKGMAVTNAFRTAWSDSKRHRHLMLVGAAGLCLGCSLPTLIVLAYGLAHDGGQAYAALEIALALGVAAGGALASHYLRGGGMPWALLGLAVMSIFSMGIAATGQLPLALLMMFSASVGNAIYLVSNQTALLSMTAPGARTSVMSARFAIGQVSVVVGSGVGGLCTSILGPRVTYAGLALVLLLVVAVFAIGIMQVPGRLPDRGVEYR